MRGFACAAALGASSLIFGSSCGDGDTALVPTFNKQVIKHRFCQTCGIHPYGEGIDPNGNKIAAINLRCIEGIDLASVPVQNFDGRSL